MKKKIRVAVLGASGYTGIECVRLLIKHPNVEIVALGTANNQGADLGMLAPSLLAYNLPLLQLFNEINWQNVDAVFSCLPHGFLHKQISLIPQSVKIIDLSADYRLKDKTTYENWYNQSHQSEDLLDKAVYGLPEFYRDKIAGANLVACPGCYPTAVLLGLLPIIRHQIASADGIIIDAKSGISGAGRSLKQNTAFCEAGEAVSPYGMEGHRHIPEIEQELNFAGASSSTINFTPHLIPMSRGELVTIYVKLQGGYTWLDALDCIEKQYENENFVTVTNGNNIVSRGKRGGVIFNSPADIPPPSTSSVRGSNSCFIAVYPNRIENYATIVAVIDNICKGSSGQAIQNLNVMFGIAENTGLESAGVFP